MIESEKKNKDRRVLVTTITTFFLLALPYVKIPNSIVFLAPITAELIVSLIFILWTAYRSHSASKKKVDATSELVLSLRSNIDSLKSEVASTEDGPIKDMLQKKLSDLYKEKIDEDSKQREEIRLARRKYEKEEGDFRAEHDALKESAMRIARKGVGEIANHQSSK